MTKTFLISVLLGIVLFLLHEFDKTVKQIRAVLRSGGAFGMVLHTEHTVFVAFHTLYRVIEDIDMCRGKPRPRKAARIDP